MELSHKRSRYTRNSKPKAHALSSQLELVSSLKVAQTSQPKLTEHGDFKVQEMYGAWMGKSESADVAFQMLVLLGLVGALG